VNPGRRQRQRQGKAGIRGRQYRWRGVYEGEQVIRGMARMAARQAGIGEAAGRRAEERRQKEALQKGAAVRAV